MTSKRHVVQCDWIVCLNYIVTLQIMNIIDGTYVITRKRKIIFALLWTYNFCISTLFVKLKKKWRHVWVTLQQFLGWFNGQNNRAHNWNCPQISHIHWGPSPHGLTKQPNSSLSEKPSKALSVIAEAPTILVHLQEPAHRFSVAFTHVHCFIFRAMTCWKAFASSPNILPLIYLTIGLCWRSSLCHDN